MPIRIMVATSAQELNDVYKLRHQVYVKGEGYFKDMAGEHIVDHFDTFPYVANIIAYNDNTPVGTIRINLDTPILLPPDELFNFGAYRECVNEDVQLEHQQSASIGSAGMLAIAKPWRNRRDVFQALFKVGCNVAKSWGATHIIATVSIKSATIYKKLGFKVLGEQFWVPSIGDSVFPVGCDLTLLYNWAFGVFAGENNELIENFSGSFQYLLISANSMVFREGEEGNEAYLIEKGNVKITRSNTKSHQELGLITLQRGGLFGELSLIDGQPRSANARTISNTELIVLSQDDFWKKIHQEPHKVNTLLKIFCKRIRDIDNRAFLYAHGSQAERLKHFINKVQNCAISLSKKDETYVAKISMEEFSYMASVSLEEAENYLANLQQNKRIKISPKEIIFYDNQPI